MALSKASQAQWKRRQNEQFKPSPPPEKTLKKTRPPQNSIIILSDGDKTTGDNEMRIVWIEEQNDVELTGFQEWEIDEQNSANDMVQFI